MNRKVAKVKISDLFYSKVPSNDIVFYAENPDEYYVFPEYFTTTNRQGHEWVWVIYWGENNPYERKYPEPLPKINGLSNLINSLPSDYF